MSGPRLLFVLSSDYGELANALYFVRDQPFHSTFLLPDRLFAANAGRLPVSARAYYAAADVLAAVDAESPDLVLLFSGYLFPVNQILEVDAVAGLVTELNRRGCPVATSDPFLGLLGRPGISPVSDAHPRKAAITTLFVRLRSIFAAVPHLDLVAVDDTDGPPRRSFFNRAILAPPPPSTELADRVASIGVRLNSSRPRWLFVLSSEDYTGQAQLHGESRFHSLVRDRLQDATRAGIEPVLVAPDACRSAAAVEGAVHLPFCGHDVFAALAVEAQYAFYWNVLSNSVAGRLVNHRPVFFFDRGHMVRSVPALFDLAVRAYYHGAKLPLLDPASGLSPAGLAASTMRQNADFEPARLAFARAPSPADVVRELTLKRRA